MLSCFFKYCFVAFIFMFVIIQPVLSQSDEISIANQYLADGDILNSLGLFHAISERTKNKQISLECHFKMGGIYGYYLDQKEKALSEYKQVLKITSKGIYAAKSTYAVGMILYEIENFKEAELVFKRYVSDFPNAANKMTAKFMIKQCEVESTSTTSIGNPTPTISKSAFQSDEKCKSVFNETQNIRILLKKTKKIIVIKGEGKVHADVVSKSVNLSFPIELKLQGKRIKVQGESISSDHVKIVAAKGLLSYNGISYRGYLVVKRLKNQLWLLNYINCEEYLRGVLPKEVVYSWNIEALKAQAITARTYVIFQAIKNIHKLYDVSATTASQVYGGASSEHKETDLAIQKTANEILCYNGKVVISCFHSNSGGFTAASKNVWVADLPYLQAAPDSFFKGTPNENWETTLKLTFIQKKLKERGIKIGHLKNVSINSITSSGRAKAMTLHSSKKDIVIKSNEFRIFIGPGIIKSTLFTITKKGKSLIFKGHGFGHGVGLPQWSAKQMADKGFSCNQILEKYFKGSKIVRISSN